MLAEWGYTEPAEPHVLNQLTTTYGRGEGETDLQAIALCAVAKEGIQSAAAVFVVNDNQLIVPQLDSNHLLVSWTKQTVQNREYIETPLFDTFICDVQERDLEMLIGEYVQ